jgi:hypothetical protein
MCGQVSNIESESNNKNYNYEKNSDRELEMNRNVWLNMPYASKEKLLKKVYYEYYYSNKDFCFTIYDYNRNELGHIYKEKITIKKIK